jgi:hypothetical protein
VEEKKKELIEEENGIALTRAKKGRGKRNGEKLDNGPKIQ